MEDFIIPPLHRTDRKRLVGVFIICLTDSVLLLSYALGSTWWFAYQRLTLILGLVYFFSLLTYLSSIVDDDRKDISFFAETAKRFNVWKNSCRSNDFRDYKGYVSDLDYLYLKKGNDIKKTIIRARIKEQDALEALVLLEQQHYHIRLVLADVDSKKILYDEKQFSYMEEYDKMINNMQNQLLENGYEIISITNKYGDRRWEQSDNPSSPSVFKIYGIGFLEILWYVTLCTIALTPLYVLGVLF